MKNRIYSFLVLVSLLFMGQGLSVSASDSNRVSYPNFIKNEIEKLNKDNFNTGVNEIFKDYRFNEEFFKNEFFELLTTIAVEAKKFNINIGKLNWKCLRDKIKIYYPFKVIDFLPFDVVRKELCKEESLFLEAYHHFMGIETFKKNLNCRRYFLYLTFSSYEKRFALKILRFFLKD